jgi:hypothetical protein
MKTVFTKKLINSFFSYYKPIRIIRIKNNTNNTNNTNNIYINDDNQYIYYLL